MENQTPALTIDTVNFKSAKELSSAIDGVLKQLNDANDKLHIVCVGALLHFKSHNDPVYIGRILNGLHKAVYKQGVVSWFRAFCPVIISEKTGVLAVAIGKPGDVVEKITLQPFDAESAFAMPWFEMPDVQAALSKTPKTIDDIEKKVSGFKTSIVSGINRQLKDGLISEEEAEEQLAFARGIVVTMPQRGQKVAA